jgi:hypothetical protein
MHTPPASRRFPSHVIELANLVSAELTTCQHVVDVLQTIDRRYPTLSFKHFVDAMRLAELAAREPGGRA